MSGNEMDWSFLKSPRFYGNFFISVGAWLQMPDPFTWAAFGVFIAAFGGLFVVVGTFDRAFDKMAAGRSAKLMTEMNSHTVTKNPNSATTSSETTVSKADTVVSMPDGV